MKAERAVSKPEFVPVIVTLESQEEVDALYAVVNHTIINTTIPALKGWQPGLLSFRSTAYKSLHSRLEKLLHGDD